MFGDRLEAGALLARRLEHLRASQPIVLGVTRGGVVVAAEVARVLGAPLDIVVVRKLGVPGFPECAMGAIAEGGGTYVNAELLQELGLGEEEVAAIAEREAIELARRVRAYRGSRGFPDIRGRTVIVVDDGIATGATACAAVRTARRRGAAHVILAAPVIAAESEGALRPDADEIVALARPSPFFAVGAWYERFDQVSDPEVVSLLQRAREDAENTSERPQIDPPAAGEVDPSPTIEEEVLAIPFGEDALEARLSVPADARGLVLFVHGGESSRHDPQDQFVARTLQRAGLATLLFDLLTEGEAREATGGWYRVEGFRDRLQAATEWASALPRTRALRLAYLGASTGAAVALATAALLPHRIAAVVSRGGRPDLVPAPTLEKVRAPVLLIVGRRDTEALALNRAAAAQLARAQLAIVPAARNRFEEPGALDAVARLAAEWLGRHLAAPHAVLPLSHG